MRRRAAWDPVRPRIPPQPRLRRDEAGGRLLGRVGRRLGGVRRAPRPPRRRRRRSPPSSADPRVVGRRSSVVCRRWSCRRWPVGRRCAGVVRRRPVPSVDARRRPRSSWCRRRTAPTRCRRRRRRGRSSPSAAAARCLRFMGASSEVVGGCTHPTIPTSRRPVDLR